MSKKSAVTREELIKALDQKLKGLGISDVQFRKGGNFEPLEFLPTGQIEIDAILGEGGGIPRGTVIEFCGESQSGKTYLAYRTLASAQSRGELTCFVNVENSFFPPRAKSLGLNTEDPITFRLLENVETAEEYGEAIYAMVDSGLFGVICVDSISAFIPQAEYEKELTDVSTIGAHAKFIKRFVKKLCAKCQLSGTIVILINQQYMGTGVIPGGQMISTATGGNAMNFFPHMRIWTKRINGAAGKVLNSQNEQIGGKSKATLMKTRYGTPWVDTEFPILFGDAESDPIAEFIFRAKAKGAEYIKEVRKKYTYADPITGEVSYEGKDVVDLINNLHTIPAPEKRTRGDISSSAFAYICGRLKMTPSQIEKLEQACVDRVNSGIDEE